MGKGHEHEPTVPRTGAQPQWQSQGSAVLIPQFPTEPHEEHGHQMAMRPLAPW